MADSAHEDRGRNGTIVVFDFTCSTELPKHGPCGLRDGRCKLRRQSYRRRVHGPPLILVLRCTEHRCSFSCYPPGYVPYARRVIDPAQVPELLEDVAEDRCELDFRTQRRWVDRFARVVAIAVRERIGDIGAGHIRLGLARHRQARQRYRSTDDWPERARVLIEVWRDIPPTVTARAFFELGWRCGAFGRAVWVGSDGVCTPARWLE